MDTDGGREMRGNLAGKQEIAGKQEESRFNHRGHRGPPRKRGKEGGERETIFNIQQGIFNSQGFWRGYLSAVAEPPCCPGSGIRIARITTNGGRWGRYSMFKRGERTKVGATIYAALFIVKK